MVKCIFDIAVALTGILFLSPFFLVIAVLIKLDSRGPVFYRQVRIGKDGKPFEILKFRTMMETEHWSGPPLSPQNDPRVTTSGAILRRLKLNELPQLINVLKGDMSFVGPRPEVPEFVGLYTDEQRRVLSVRPGIVGPCQIHMRNEEELFPDDADPKEYYAKHILPMKLAIDLEYVNTRSLIKDIWYIFRGVMITVTGGVTRRHLFQNAEQIALFFCDTVICTLSYFLAYLLRMEGTFPPAEKAIFLHSLPYVITVRMVTFTFFGLYTALIRYVSFNDLVKIAKGVTLSSILIVLLIFFIGERAHPRSVFAIDWFIVVCLLGGYRLSFKALMDRAKSSPNGPTRNTLIYGVGTMGDLAFRYLRTQENGKVIGFVDDDPKKIRKSFQGLKVLGNRYDIEALVRLYRVDRIVIAMDSVETEALEHLKSLCEQAAVGYETFNLANGGVTQQNRSL